MADFQTSVCCYLIYKVRLTWPKFFMAPIARYDLSSKFRTFVFILILGVSAIILYTFCCYAARCVCFHYQEKGVHNLSQSENFICPKE